MEDTVPQDVRLKAQSGRGGKERTRKRLSV